jgi:hypothetical protein
MRGTVIVMSLSMVIKEPFIRQKPIQTNCFADFALAFLVKKIIFNNIMSTCPQSRTKIPTEICRLTILALCIDQILEQKPKFT